MEIKKILGLLTVPAVAFLSTSCSSTIPDVANYLAIKCQIDPTIESVHQQIELIPGQKVRIANELFELTDKGRLRYTDEYNQANIEIGSKDIIVKGNEPYYEGLRYSVRNLSSETGNKFTIDVACNCQDPKADPK